MKALRKLAPGPGGVELIEVPDPQPGVGQALIEVAAAGICGTDLHILAGEYQTTTPVTIGHEVAGRVVAVGEDVPASWLDAHVVSETYFAICGRCPRCRGGQPNLCDNRRSIGTHVDGAFAASVVVPVGNLRLVPEGVSTAAASMTEPLACVCHCLCDPSRVDPGDRVLVVGPGPIGLLAAQVARAAGGDVVVSGRPSDGARLDLARTLGFDVAVDGETEVENVDVAIECSGSGGGVTAALKAARRGGRLVLIGLAGRPVTVPLDDVCFKQLTVTSGLAQTPTSWDRALGLIADGRVQLDPLISEVAGLDDWERLFAAASGGEGAKFVFDPRMPSGVSAG